MLSTIVGVICVIEISLANDVDHVKTWGDLSKPGSYLTQIESKVGIPFFHRKFTISYPDVSFTLKLFEYITSGHWILEMTD